MNEIKISGVLGTVAEQDSGKGRFLTARLRFGKTDEVVLVAAGERVHLLDPFDSGEAVRIVGRLAVVNGGLVVVVDEVAVGHRQRSSASLSQSRRVSTGGTR